MQHLFAQLAARLKRTATIIVAGGMALLLPATALAQSLIRDAEIEHTLRVFSDPVFKAEGLTPSSIKIYIVNDPTINAFVMGGSNMFVNTGLIMKSETPDMLIGVIAHESGHIAGGHLVRTNSELEHARMQAMLGYLLGAAAMAGGAGKAGAAVMSANEQIAMRGMYTFTRANEQAADQAALTALDSLGITANGMLKLFEILRKQEYRNMGGDPDPYTKTHPLSKERIMHIRNHIGESKIPTDAIPEGYQKLEDRMLGKLEGFLDEPTRVIDRYPTSDTSVRARYARAVAHHRLIEADMALAEMDALLAESPDDPYFNELKGQILFESGRVSDAREAYKKAVDLLPDAPLIRVELANALLASENDKDLPAAISHLEYATSAERENPQAWRALATAYGRNKQLDLSTLALAEESLVLNKPEQALQQLDAAKNYIKVGSPAELRAQDLRAEAQRAKKEKEKES